MIIISILMPPSMSYIRTGTSILLFVTPMLTILIFTTAMVMITISGTGFILLSRFQWNPLSICCLNWNNSAILPDGGYRKSTSLPGTYATCRPALRLPA